MPYASDAQRRFMHAKHPEIAARWDAEEKAAKAKKRKTGVKVKVERGETVTMDGVEKGEVVKSRALTRRLAVKSATKPRRAARTIAPLPDNAKDMTPDEIRARLKRNIEIIDPKKAKAYRGRKPNSEPREFVEGTGINVRPQQAKVGATIALGSAGVGTPALIHHHRVNSKDQEKVDKASNVREFSYLPENIRSMARPSPLQRNPVSPLNLYASSAATTRFLGSGAMGRARRPRKKDLDAVHRYNLSRMMLFSPLGRGSVQGM